MATAPRCPLSSVDGGVVRMLPGLEALERQLPGITQG